MAFQCQYSDQIVDWIANVGPLRSGLSFGNAVEPFQSHDMIDAQSPSVTHVCAHQIDKGLVRLRLECDGAQGRQSPVWPAGLRMSGGAPTWVRSRKSAGRDQ